jgi:hypothetical protein
MDEVMRAVSCDEFRDVTAAMLTKPGPQVIGDANVKRPVSAAGEDVDVIFDCADGMAPQER